VGVRKSINGNITRIGGHLDQVSHGLNRLDSIVDRMVAILRETGGLEAKLRKEGR